jgi:hypothetical protein
MSKIIYETETNYDIAELVATCMSDEDIVLLLSDLLLRQLQGKSVKKFKIKLIRGRKKVLT